MRLRIYRGCGLARVDGLGVCAIRYWDRLDAAETWVRRTGGRVVVAPCGSYRTEDPGYSEADHDWYRTGLHREAAVQAAMDIHAR